MRRVLVVGDSTGAGVGCDDSAESVAGRVATDLQRVEVHNVSKAGATVADVLERVRTLPPVRRFDLVLVFAGGNDILRRTSTLELRRSVRALLGQLHLRGTRIIWVGIANVGLAPAFLPPLSWWLTSKARRTTRLLAEESARSGAYYVDFFRERAVDPFSAAPGRYYADDGIHPSARGYGYCYRRMKPLIYSLLSAAPEPEVVGTAAAPSLEIA